jgi:hypothetical protein
MACWCAAAHAFGHKHEVVEGRELGPRGWVFDVDGESSRREEMEAGVSCEDSTRTAGLRSLAASIAATL